jgi:hypothetical protein
LVVEAADGLNWAWWTAADFSEASAEPESISSTWVEKPANAPACS